MVVSFERKTSGTFVKKTGRSFENMVVLTKIVNYFTLCSRNIYACIYIYIIYVCKEQIRCKYKSCTFVYTHFNVVS